MKRTLALILAIVMVFVLVVPAMAEGAGSITIKGNDTINVENGSFTAYKMLNLKTNADGDKYAYTVPAELKAFYAKYFKLDATKGSFDVDVYEAIAALDKNDVALRALAKAVKESGEAKNFTGAGVSGKNEYKISGLDDGYYLVYDYSDDAVAVSAIMIDTVNQNNKEEKGNVEIDVKADAPSIQKWIVKEDGSKVKGDSASLGEKVSFEIDSAVPSFEGYSSYTFKITDVYEPCFVMDLSTVVVTVGGETLGEDDYTLTPGGEVSGSVFEEDEAFTILFTDIMNYNPGDEIVITYTSTFVDDCAEGDIACLDHFYNDAYLEYSSNPNTDDTSTVVDRVFVRYAGIVIMKTDAESGEILPGAEFEITGERADTVRVVHCKFAKLDSSDERYNEVYPSKGESSVYFLCDDGEYRMLQEIEGQGYNPDDRYYPEVDVELIETTETVHATGVTGEDGNVYFFGLGAGEYTITELKAPDGYNKLAEPIVVNIVYDIEKDEFTATGYNVDGGALILPVENSSGTELPSTGGMGTTIFYIVGSLLVIGAAVVLVSKKRMSAEG